MGSDNPFGMVDDATITDLAPLIVAKGKAINKKVGNFTVAAHYRAASRGLVAEDGTLEQKVTVQAWKEYIDSKPDRVRHWTEIALYREIGQVSEYFFIRPTPDVLPPLSFLNALLSIAKLWNSLLASNGLRQLRDCGDLEMAHETIKDPANLLCSAMEGFRLGAGFETWFEKDMDELTDKLLTATISTTAAALGAVAHTSNINAPAITTTSSIKRMMASARSESPSAKREAADMESREGSSPETMPGSPEPPKLSSGVKRARRH